MELLGVKMMDIVAFRSRFQGKDSIGKPFGELLSVSIGDGDNDDTITIQEDGLVDISQDFLIETYDRNNEDDQNSAFYQIVFRIQGTESEKRVYQLVLKPDNNNPLQYDEANDLWYQLTKFNSEGRPDTTSLLTVDSINTAGVFKVVIMQDGEPVLPLIEKRIQVLPSQVRKNDYQRMLNELIKIHERLVVKNNSAVGTGTFDSKKLVKSLGTPEYDLDLWERLKPLLFSVMKVPDSLLKKTYLPMRQDKISRFDSAVIRSFAQRGEGNKSIGISYSGDLDIYENRIIKWFLRLFLSRICPIQKVDLPNKSKRLQELKKKNYTEDYIRNTDRKLATQVISYTNNPLAQLRGNYCFSFPYVVKYRNNKRHQTIYLEITNDSKYKIETTRQSYTAQDGSKKALFDFYPFSIENTHAGARFITPYADVALQILSSLQRIYKSNVRGELKVTFSRHTVEKAEDYYYADKKWGEENVEVHTFDEVTSCYLDQPTIFSVSNYRDFLTELSKLKIAEYCAYMPSEIDYCDYLTGLECRLEKSLATAKTNNKLFEVRNAIKCLLETSWFLSIADINYTGIHITPLFSLNVYYSEIYAILTTFLKAHPLLSSSFDRNLYGSLETHFIYEYWCFAKIMERFTDVGFRVADESNMQKILSTFSAYIETNKKPEKFTVLLKRVIPKLTDSGSYSGKYSTVELLLGYNCIIGDQKAPELGKKGRHKYLTPDYFVRVTSNNGYHWYFLDAKYRVYTDTLLDWKPCENRESLYQVCIKRYINRIAEKKHQFIRQFAEDHARTYPREWASYGPEGPHTIMGAYLIVADTKNHCEEDLAVHNRLYGFINAFPPENNEYEHMPVPFPFGSITLRPDLTDELTALIAMIFEYKESAQYIELDPNGKKQDGTPEHLKTNGVHKTPSYANRPVWMNACWDSSVEHDDESLSIEPQRTLGGNYKYYVSCTCGSRRYDTFCINTRCRHEIIKHDVENYHVRSGTGRSKRERWNYICPYCGEEISDDE